MEVHREAAATERRSAQLFGFSSLLCWTTLGMALEAAHAFKLSSYLDHPLRRELLVWGHAHGVGLSLVMLAYAAGGVATEQPARQGRLLRAASLLIPIGFVASVAGHGEADPGPAIWLVPLGALSLLLGLLGVVRSLSQAPR